MQELDLSRDPSIAILHDLVRALSQAETSQQVLGTFSSGMRKLGPPSAFISVSRRGLRPSEYKITRLLLDEHYLGIDEADPWRDWATMRVHTGGILGQLIARDAPTVIENLDVTDDPVLGGHIAGFKSMMAVPLYDGGEALNWAFHLRRSPEGFPLDGVGDQLLRGNLVGGTVKHVQTALALREANARIRREMERIAEIQRAILPAATPHVPGLSIAASYEVFDQAGGDLYDVVKLSPVPNDPSPACGELWGLTVADVSGHGPSAAVVAAMLHAILHSYPGHACNPADVLAYANHHLCNKRIELSFVTAFLAGYRTESKDFVYARAGHNPPLLVTGSSESDLLTLDEVGDLPLGITHDAEYEPAKVRLEPGQTVLMFTDGIVEAASPSDGLFGESRLRRTVLESDGTPADVIRHVNAAVARHQAGLRPTDDQTMLALRVDP